MSWYGIWNGGHSYARGEHEHVELFANLAEARAKFEERLNGSWRRSFFNFVNQAPQSSYCPAVDESSTLELYATDPSWTDHTPDRVISIGPKGGIKVEVA